MAQIFQTNEFVFSPWRIDCGVMVDTKDLADLQRAFIVAVTISDLLWVAK